MKRKFEDIIPEDRRTIRNIAIPKREKNELGHRPSMDGIKAGSLNGSEIKFYKNKKVSLHESEKTISVTKKTKSKENVSSLEEDNFPNSEINVDTPKNRWKAWTFIIILLLVVGYFFSSYFTYADININLAKHLVSVSDINIPLNKIKYTVVSSNISKTETVQAKGVQQVSKKAVGTVFIYNAINSSPQNLSSGTRLESSNGHIFKTDIAVSVPAVQIVNGKSIPGSVLVNITADQPGDASNIGLKDFTLPGFKGTDKYTGIYARSKSSLAGGFIGTVPNVSPSDLLNSEEYLKKQIKDEVVTNINTKIKEVFSDNNDYHYLADTNIIDYGSPDIKLSKDGKSADVSISANVTALALSNASLAEFLVHSSTTTPQVDPESTQAVGQFVTGSYFADFSKLNLSLPSGLTSKNLLALANASSTNASLGAKGTASIASTVNESAIASAVSHLSKTQAIEVVKGIVDFQAIEIAIKPWWLNDLPDASNIRINIEK